MMFRAFVVVGSLVVSLILSAALIVQERIPDLERPEEIQLADEPLRHMTYASNTRIQNLKEMGMDDGLASSTANRISQLQENRDKYRRLLQEQAILVGNALCPTTNKLPQPYALLEFLVAQEGENRSVINPYRIVRLEKQPWFAAEAYASQVYMVIERDATGRRQDATLMGVAALLARREADALEARSYWSSNFLEGGTFSDLVREKPGIRKTVINYFALMHYLTELANEHDGICR